VSDDIDQEISSRLGLGQIASQGGQTDEVSYMIWAAAVSTTRAFDKVSLKVDPNSNRIFVAIKLRWWAKFQKFKILHDSWLRIAEGRCKEVTPDGFKLLVYYDKGTDGL